MDDAARIGVGAVREAAEGIVLVRFVLASERALAAFEAAVAAR